MSEYAEVWELVFVTALIASLGAVVVYYAFRIYLREHQRAMAFLGVGFLLVSAGSALSWWWFWFSGWDAVACQLGTVGVSTAGFVSIIYALRSRA